MGARDIRVDVAQPPAADTTRARAEHVVAAFLADVGPQGALRELARAHDRGLAGGDACRRLDQRSLQLAPGYDPKDALRWRTDRGAFELAGELLDHAAAIARVEQAIAADPRLEAQLERTMAYQRRVFVEELGKGFATLRERLLDGFTLRGALAARDRPPPRPAQLPQAFAQGDALRASRIFTGLSRARDAVEASCLARIQALPVPRSREQRVHYLAQLGYAPPVAAAMVDHLPHVARAVIELSREALRLPRDAREGWSYFFQGDLAFQPGRLLRGVDAESFDPRFVRRFNREAGREFSYFSDQLGYPVMRALWSYTGGRAGPERTHGLLVELQVPKLLVLSSDNGHPALLQKMVPDQEALIARIGAVPFRPDAAQISDCARADNIGMVEWRARDAAEQAGWITPRDPAQQQARLEVHDPAEWVRSADRTGGGRRG